MGQNSLTPDSKLNNLLNFPLAREQVVHLENEANLCVGQCQANHFLAVCFIFDLGGITQYVMINSIARAENGRSPCLTLTEKAATSNAEIPSKGK